MNTTEPLVNAVNVYPVELVGKYFLAHCVIKICCLLNSSEDTQKLGNRNGRPLDSRSKGGWLSVILAKYSQNKLSPMNWLSSDA